MPLGSSHALLEWLGAGLGFAFLPAAHPGKQQAMALLFPPCQEPASEALPGFKLRCLEMGCGHPRKCLLGDSRLILKLPSREFSIASLWFLHNHGRYTFYPSYIGGFVFVTCRFILRRDAEATATLLVVKI